MLQLQKCWEAEGHEAHGSRNKQLAPIPARRLITFPAGVLRCIAVNNDTRKRISVLFLQYFPVAVFFPVTPFCLVKLAFLKTN